MRTTTIMMATATTATVTAMVTVVTITAMVAVLIAVATAAMLVVAAVAATAATAAAAAEAATPVLKNWNGHAPQTILYVEKWVIFYAIFVLKNIPTAAWLPQTAVPAKDARFSATPKLENVKHV